MPAKSFPRPKTVTEYIAACPLSIQDKLYQMLNCIRKAAPGAEETLKWGKPAFSYDRILVVFAASKNHIGFYPTPSAIKAFAKDLSAYKTGPGSIRFPLDKPLPVSLISKITRFRVKESREDDIKWKS